MIKFVSALRQVGGFLRCTPVSSINKTYCYDIIEILLKVALNTITLIPLPFTASVYQLGLFKRFLGTLDDFRRSFGDFQSICSIMDLTDEVL